MTPELKRALRTDFESFVRKAHGEPLEDPYVGYLCHELGQVPRGRNRRLIVSLPPRHLKTFACSVCLPAYILGRQPAAKVLVITYGENLAADIAHGIRELLRTQWFKAAFSTRLAADRNRATDFATTAGGRVYAQPIGGQLTGYGANYIIIDDPLEMKDANNVVRIAFVNGRFDEAVRTRFDHPSTGTIVIVAHRLNEADLAWHVLAEGDWKQIVLPFEATRNEVFDLGNGGTWKRTKGELLRPAEFSAKDCERLRKSSNFRALYQQDPSATGLPAIEPRHFALAPRGLNFDRPVVISIDTGEALGLHNSYSVVQVWQVAPDGYILSDQWRDRVAYGELRAACKTLIGRHRPTVVLIERAGSGRALASDLASRSLDLIEVTPHESKLERLRTQIDVILGRKIALSADAPWRHAYVKEFIEFPRLGTDQVDATTQFLDFMAGGPLLRARSKREPLVVALGSRPGVFLNNMRGRKFW